MLASSWGKGLEGPPALRDWFNFATCLTTAGVHLSQGWAGSPIPLESLGNRVGCQGSCAVLSLRRASGTAGLGAVSVTAKPTPEEREWGVALPLRLGCDWGQGREAPLRARAARCGRDESCG